MLVDRSANRDNKEQKQYVDPWDNARRGDRPLLPGEEAVRRLDLAGVFHALCRCWRLVWTHVHVKQREFAVVRHVGCKHCIRLELRERTHKRHEEESEIRRSLASEWLSEKSPSERSDSPDNGIGERGVSLAKPNMSIVKSLYSIAVVESREVIRKTSRETTECVCVGGGGHQSRARAVRRKQRRDDKKIHGMFKAPSREASAGRDLRSSPGLQDELRL
jgi:hypothetical protein